MGNKTTTSAQRMRKLREKAMALQRAGSHERVSHKSLKAQGIEREPTAHLGPVATAMERRGLRTDRGELNSAQGHQTEREELAALEQQQAGISAARNRAHQWQQEQVRAAAGAQRQDEMERERQKELEAQERKRQQQERAQKLEADRKAREKQRQKEPQEQSHGMRM